MPLANTFSIAGHFRLLQEAGLFFTHGCKKVIGVPQGVLQGLDPLHLYFLERAKPCLSPPLFRIEIL